jgi:hypothetical protein
MGRAVLPRLSMMIEGAFLSLHFDGLAITIPTTLCNQNCCLLP